MLHKLKFITDLKKTKTKQKQHPVGDVSGKPLVLSESGSSGKTDLNQHNPTIISIRTSSHSCTGISVFKGRVTGCDLESSLSVMHRVY